MTDDLHAGDEISQAFMVMRLVHLGVKLDIADIKVKSLNCDKVL